MKIIWLLNALFRFWILESYFDQIKAKPLMLFCFFSQRIIENEKYNLIPRSVKIGLKCLSVSNLIPGKRYGRPLDLNPSGL